MFVVYRNFNAASCVGLQAFLYRYFTVDLIHIMYMIHIMLKKKTQLVVQYLNVKY